MYCGQCGKTNSDRARFCVYCGRPLSAAPAPAGAVGGPPRRLAPIGAPPTADDLPYAEPLEPPARQKLPLPAPPPRVPHPPAARPARVQRRPRDPRRRRRILLWTSAACVILGLGIWLAVHQIVAAHRREQARQAWDRMQQRTGRLAAGDRTALREQIAQDPQVRQEALEAMIPRLAASEQWARQDARRTLDQLDPAWAKSEAARAAVPELVRGLESTDESRATDVADALGDIGDRGAIKPLILATVRSSVDRTCLAALSRIAGDWAAGPEAAAAVDAVAQELNARDLDRRGAAARMLGRIGGTQASRALILQRFNRNDPEERLPLEAALDQIDPEWRRSPAMAVVIPQCVFRIETLPREDLSKNEWLIRDMAQSGNDAAMAALLHRAAFWPNHYDPDELLRMVEKFAPDWRTSAEARAAALHMADGLPTVNANFARLMIDVMAEAKDPKMIVPLYLTGLSVSVLKARSEQALEAVHPAWRKSPEVLAAMPRLAQFVASTREQASQQCAALMAEAAGKAAIGPLLEVLADPNASAGADALFAALQRIDANWPVSAEARQMAPRLMEAAAPRSRRACAGAAAALGYMRHRPAIPGLIVASCFAKETEWDAYATALARIDPAWRQGTEADAAANTLLGRLADRESPVRVHAARMLGELKLRLAIDPLAGRLTDESALVRDAAIDGLARMDPADMSTRLPPLLDDADARIRLAACRIAGAGRHTAAGPALVARLLDADREVCGEAARALEAFGAAAWPSSEQVGRLASALTDAIEAGKGGTTETRSLLARVLAQAGGPEAVKPLVALLKDRQYTVCRDAARALGQSKQADAVAPLAAALLDARTDPYFQDMCDSLRTLSPDWQKRREFADLLPRLAASAGGRHPDVRDQIVRLLGETGDAAAVAPLLDFAGKDEVPTVRQHALDALAAIGDPKAYDGVVGLLDNPSADVRHAAIRALGRIDGPRRIEILAGLIAAEPGARNDDARLKAVVALREAGGERKALTVMLAAAHENDGLVDQMAQAVNSLPAGPALRDPLVEALLTETDARLSNALLGRTAQLNMRIPEAAFVRTALPRVREAAGSPHVAIRRAAVVLAARMDPSAASDLIDKALGDPDPTVRLAAIQNAGGIGPVSERSRKAYASMLADPDPEVRKYAADQCIRYEIQPPAEVDEGRVGKLLEDLASTDKTAYVSAVRALGLLREKRATATLLETVTSGRYDVTEELHALGRIGDPASIDPLIDQFAAMKHPAYLLGPMLRRLDPDWVKRPAGQRAIATLIKRLDAADESERGRVAGVLAYCPHPKVAAALCRLLDSADATTKRNAAEALVRIADPVSTDALIAALKGPNAGVRTSAARALAAIGDNRAAEAVQQQLARETDKTIIIEMARSLYGLGRTDESIRPLLGLVDDGDPLIRSRALDGLAATHERRFIPLMLRKLCDRTWMIQPVKYAHFSNFRGWLYRLDPKWTHSDEAAEAIDDLLAALKQEPGETRSNAVYALAMLRHPRAVGPLLSLLDDGQISDTSFYNAVEALGQIGGPEALAGLRAREGRLAGPRQQWVREGIARLAAPASRPASAPAAP